MNSSVYATIFAFLLLVDLSTAFPNSAAISSPCRNGKEFHICGPSCPETCDTLRQKQNGPNFGVDLNDFQNNREKTNDDTKKNGNGLLCKLCSPGCHCKKGLVENKLSNSCVLPSLCPRL